MKMVSVIIPAFNAASYLMTALDSLDCQTYKNIEVIVVDDCSSDDTYSLLLSLQNSNHYSFPLYIYKMSKNSGQGNARNLGISKAKGDYIMFLDADDRFEPCAVQNMLTAMNTGVDICMCSFSRFRMGEIQHGLFSSKEGIFKVRDFLTCIFKVWPLNWFSCIGTKIYKTDIISNNQIQFNDISYRYNEDLGFIVDYIRACNNVKVINDELYSYTYTPGSVQHKRRYRDNSILTIRNSRLNLFNLLKEYNVLDSLESDFKQSQIELYNSLLITHWSSFYQFKDVFDQICNFQEVVTMSITDANNILGHFFLWLAKGRKYRIAFIFYLTLDAVKEKALDIKNSLIRRGN